MKALLVHGGWDGHEPTQIAAIVEKTLKREGFRVELSDTLEVLADGDRLAGLDLIVPHWTMGSFEAPQQ